MTVVVSLLVTPLSELDVQKLVVINIPTRLKLSGDVESNSGPYEILRSIQESFNEDKIALDGGTIGSKCAFNALFSICWSVVHNLCFWKLVHLDYLLV